jgi:hypothetical protein
VRDVKANGANEGSCRVWLLLVVSGHIWEGHPLPESLGF